MPDPALQRLGDAVLAHLVATYTPSEADDLALAVLPGVPVPGDLIQDGRVNPLNMDRWLGGTFDQPLRLRLSDATPLPGAIGSDLPLRRLYRTIALWAQPADPGAPDAPRVASLIDEARRDLGPVEAADTLGTEPSDWADPDGPVAWHTFDLVIRADSETVTHADPPPDEGDGPTVVGPARFLALNPELWQLRAVEPPPLEPDQPDPVILADRDAREQAVLERIVAAPAVRELVTAQPDVMAARISPAVRLGLEGSLAPATGQPFGVLRVDSAELSMHLGSVTSESIEVAPVGRARFVGRSRFVDRAEPIDPDVVLVAPEDDRPPDRVIPPRRVLDPGWLGDRFVQVAGTAPVESVTTTHGELHLHFEHTAVALTRSARGTRWWHEELLADDGWLVPGLARGTLIPAAEGERVPCMPRSLLVVRGLSVTGVFTDEARATLESAGSMLGPFLLPSAPTRVETSSSSAIELAISASSPQVIGVLCSRLPVLPPHDG